MVSQVSTSTPYVKITNEPPKGLRTKMLNAYNTSPIADADVFGGCDANPR